jgi:hypothetical protein
MSSDLEYRIPAIDPAELLHAVREQQDDPGFKVLEWNARPIRYHQFIDTTGGLYQITGTGSGRDGHQAWSVVLKLLNNPKGNAERPRDIVYWKREYLAFQSRMLAELPAGLSVPRCFGTAEHGDTCWIWMEHIEESTAQRWNIEDFYRAARHAGRFAAAYLKGAPVPNHYWLSEPFFRGLLADDRELSTYLEPDAKWSVWESPLIREGFGEALLSAAMHIWREKRTFWEIQDKLPTVLCHNDFNRRNLMFHRDADGNEDLVAIDWALCGPGAVATDLGMLVLISSSFFEVEPEELADLEAAAIDGYFAGLADAGWKGEIELVKLGYLLSVVMRAPNIPISAAGRLSGEARSNVPAIWGRSPDEVLEGWVRLTEFLLSHAENARRLSNKLGL